MNFDDEMELLSEIGQTVPQPHTLVCRPPRPVAVADPVMVERERCLRAIERMRDDARARIRLGVEARDVRECGRQRARRGRTSTWCRFSPRRTSP